MQHLHGHEVTNVEAAAQEAGRELGRIVKLMVARIEALEERVAQLEGNSKQAMSGTNGHATER
jgi:hypothetical protein